MPVPLLFFLLLLTIWAETNDDDGLTERDTCAHDLRMRSGIMDMYLMTWTCFWSCVGVWNLQRVKKEGKFTVLGFRAPRCMQSLVSEFSVLLASLFDVFVGVFGLLLAKEE
jgi:hypothetical protein